MGSNYRSISQRRKKALTPYIDWGGPHLPGRSSPGPPTLGGQANVVPPTREGPVLRHIGLDNTSPSSPAGFLYCERLGPRAGNIHGPNITWRHCWRGWGGDDPRDLKSGLQLSCQGCCQGILRPLALTLPLKSDRSPLPCQQTPSDEQHVCCTLHVCEAAQRVSWVLAIERN